MTAIETFLRLPYAIEVVPDTTTDGGLCYLATHPELPGCMAHGDTIDEAIQNLADARRLYISTLVKRGLEVPLPKAITGTSIQRQQVIWKREEPVPPQTEPQREQQFRTAA